MQRVHSSSRLLYQHSLGFALCIVASHAHGLHTLGGAIHEASAVLQASLCCAEGPPSPSGRQRLVLLPLRAGTIALTAAACAAPSQCRSLPPLGTPPHWPSMPRCMEPPELLLQVLTLLTAAVCAMMTLNIQRRFCLCCDISYQTMLLLCVY